MLESLFQLREHGTDVRTEILGGVTTFMTMAYIVFVNPALLSQVGMDFEAVMVATCLSAGVSIATTAAFGTSSLVLLRLRSEQEALAFLVVASVAVLVSWMSDRTDMPVLDPLVAMIVAAATTGAIAGSVWAPDLLNTVAASVAAALALVAGRNLGTLLRAGGFFVAGPIPGSLHYLDGVIMASGPFWVLLTVLG